MNIVTSLLLSIFFSLSYLIAQEDWKDNFVFERTTSFGLMSEKLGTDFWNLSSTIYRKKIMRFLLV